MSKAQKSETACPHKCAQDGMCLEKKSQAYNCAETRQRNDRQAMVCVYQTLHTMCSFAIHVHTNSRCPSKIPLHESSSTLWAWYTCNIGRYHISHRPFRTFRTCFADVSRASHRLFRTFRTRFATFRACFAHVSRMSHKVFRTFRACFAHVSHV